MEERMGKELWWFWDFLWVGGVFLVFLRVNQHFLPTFEAFLLCKKTGALWIVTNCPVVLAVGFAR